MRVHDQLFSSTISQVSDYGFLFSSVPVLVEGPMSFINYSYVRSQVSISQVLDLLDFHAAQSHGDQRRGPCPIHKSHSPKSTSLSVSLRKNAYQCFVCKSAGNQLDLWAAATQQPLNPATAELCQRLNLKGVHHLNRF
jgi:DNA primase